MLKLIAFAAVLASAGAACKTDAESATTAPASDDNSAATSGKNRSGKIDLPQVKPTPDDSSASAGSGDRPKLDPEQRKEWRKHRDEKLDADGDGVVTDAERAAARHQRAVDMLTRLDADGDGKVTVDEMAKASGRRMRMDPATVDTNKDGVVSADELEAAMKSRADQWRGGGGRRGGGPRGGGDPDGAADPAAPAPQK
jgi:EF hand domain-containing protein